MAPWLAILGATVPRRIAPDKRDYRQLGISGSHFPVSGLHRTWKLSRSFDAVVGTASLVSVSYQYAALVIGSAWSVPLGREYVAKRIGAASKRK